MKIKKENLQKSAQIVRMQNQEKRKDILFRKTENELNEIKKTDKLIKQLTKNENKFIYLNKEKRSKIRINS